MDLHFNASSPVKGDSLKPVGLFRSPDSSEETRIHTTAMQTLEEFDEKPSPTSSKRSRDDSSRSRSTTPKKSPRVSTDLFGANSPEREGSLIARSRIILSGPECPLAPMFARPRESNPTTLQFNTFNSSAVAGSPVRPTQRSMFDSPSPVRPTQRQNRVAGSPGPRTPEGPDHSSPGVQPRQNLRKEIPKAPNKAQIAQRQATLSDDSVTLTQPGRRVVKKPEFGSSRTEVNSTDEVMYGLVVNGRIYPYAPVAHGEWHQVIRLTGENRRITWLTHGGPVSFMSDEVVVRYPHDDILPSAYIHNLRADMRCYELYLGRGLPLPIMYIRPDLGVSANRTHRDTFIDTAKPNTSGAFAVVEKVEAGFTVDAVNKVVVKVKGGVPVYAANAASSLAEVRRRDARTGELMDFALEQWTMFLRFMALHSEPPYTRFPGTAILFHDFRPDNVGRNAQGFLHLDQLSPEVEVPANDSLFKSLTAFVDKNRAIFDEILNRLLDDQELEEICGSDFPHFETSLRRLLTDAFEARNRTATDPQPGLADDLLPW